MSVDNSSATPRARTLAAAIRSARKASGHSGREIGRQLGISHSAVSHWETGKRTPRLEDVASFLGLLGITGAERERILDLARHANEPDWLTVGVPGEDQQLAGLLECERTAEKITSCAPWIIPGLCQISDYARVIIGADDRLNKRDVEKQVLLRMGRPHILNRRDLNQVVFLVGEPALRQEIGSAATMADQLRQLLAMSKLPKVTIRVVPIGQGWHPGVVGPFVLYEFAATPSIVHIEHYRSSAFLYNETDTAAYRDAAAVICRKALTVDESARFIADRVEELEKT